MPARAEQPSVCRLFYDSTRGRAVAIFQDHAHGIGQKRKALSKLFEETVDVAWIAEHVAGPYWDSADARARAAYIANFRAYLLQHYIGKLDEENLDGLDDIVLGGFAVVGNGVYAVNTQITQKNDDPVTVDFRLEEAPPGHCQIHDFTVEGVDLVTVQRAEIQSLGAQGGMALITQRLEQQAEQPAH